MTKSTVPSYIAPSMEWEPSTGWIPLKPVFKPIEPLFIWIRLTYDFAASEDIKQRVAAIMMAD